MTDGSVQDFELPSTGKSGHELRDAGGPEPEPEGGEVAISVRGLVKRYDRRDVVDHLSFSVQRGEVFALLGPNGAGKTTTVEILEGYRRPDGGAASVLGLDPWQDGARLRSRLGLMLQQGGIYPQAHPIEILRLFARFFENPRDPDALLDMVGLRPVARTRYKVLSGGEKQRLGLALALIGRPELTILDEPTAGMDPAAKAATRTLIGALKDEGVTVLLTTHELADAERLADRVALIDRGRLVALGTPAELIAGSNPMLRFRLAASLGESDRLALERELRSDPPGTRLVEEGTSGWYRLQRPEPSAALVARLTEWCRRREILVLELRTRGGTLEERYLELLAREEGE